MVSCIWAITIVVYLNSEGVRYLVTDMQYCYVIILMRLVPGPSRGESGGHFYTLIQ